jgi:hypothetical protein
VLVLGLLIGVLFSVSELGLLPVVPGVLGVPVGFGFFHIVGSVLSLGSLAQGADSWGNCAG